MKRLIFIVALFGATAAYAGAEEGLWLTEPTKTGKKLIIRIKPCASLVCGYLAGALDAGGHEIPAYPNTGDLFFWDLTAKGDGSFSGGKIQTPAISKPLGMTMSVRGNSITVRACFGLICKKQALTRIE